MPTVGLPHVSGYEIMGVLGRGGMGVVYQAEQLALKRPVALKMILAGGYADPQELTRFRMEAEAVARLQHPHIVQIYEVGEWQPDSSSPPAPYFSLEFVDGGSLDKKLNGTPLPAAQAAQLAETLANAMHAAHRRGVVHRDLKPANVLLARSDRPQALPLGSSPESAERYEPKISDFGLAKHLEADSAQTHTGQVMGTPSYMAPEQAAGRTREIGPGTDVYALGAILYELLTGRPPFKGATALDTLEQVRSQEPAPPSRLQPGLPRDLETICLKCLEKQPRRRYLSAEALADDLRRFREHEPIQARPSGVAERAWKWAKRRPALAALALVSAAAALILIAGGLWYQTCLEMALVDAQDKSTAAQRARNDAEEQRDELRRHLYSLQIPVAFRAWEEGQLDRARELLEVMRPQAGAKDLRGFEWHYLWQRCHTRLFTLKGHDGAVTCVAFSHDGRRLASAGADGTIRIWDAARGLKLFNLQAHPGGATCIAFSKDGQRLASCGLDKTVKIWNPATGSLLASLDKLQAAGSATKEVKNGLTKDGVAGRGYLGVQLGELDEDVAARLGVAKDAGVLVVQVMKKTPAAKAGLKADDVVTAIGGKRVKTSKMQQTVVAGLPLNKPAEVALVRGGKTTTVQVTIEEQPAAYGIATRFPVHALALSPDGQRLAWATGEVDMKSKIPLPGAVRLWDVLQGEELFTLNEQRGPVTSIYFSPDGQRLSTVCGGSATLWDLTSRQELYTLKAPQPHHVANVALSADGRHIASGSPSGEVILWDAAKGQPLFYLAAKGSQSQRSPGGSVSGLSFSPDGRRLAWSTVGEGGGGFGGGGAPWHPPEVNLWNVNQRESLFTFRGHSQAVNGIAFSADGRRLASASADRTVQIWDTTAKPNFLRLKDLGAGIYSAAVSLDGRRLATANFDFSKKNFQRHLVKLWNFETGEELLSLKGFSDFVQRVTLSRDGRRLAAAGNNRIAVWDVSTGREILTKAGIAGTVAFSPDGRRVAAVAREEGVQIWDTDSAVKGQTFKLHDRGFVEDVAFSPDGRRLAAATMQGTVHLWDTDTAEAILTLSGHADHLLRLAFSPDGQRLVSASQAGTLRIWDTVKGQELFTLRGHTNRVTDLAFNPAGDRLASASHDGTVRLWEVKRGLELLTLKRPTVYGLAFSPDGYRLIAVGADGTAGVWDATPMEEGEPGQP